MASINFASHTCVGKSVISNRERGVAVTKINDHDKKCEKFMATVYFIVQTNMDEYQGFSLRKIMGPTQIYGCMKGRSRSTIENMSQSRNAHGVQRRRVGWIGKHSRDEALHCK